MSELLHEKIGTGAARIVPPPALRPVHQVEVDRSFELPTGLYGATVALYLGFLAVMLGAFAAPGLAIPMTIFALFIIAGFGIPAVWTRLAVNRSKAMTFGQLKMKGIMTHTGRCAARDAVIQMLILPVLIVCWAVAVAIIAAIVA